jgi:hypothetical protein
MYMFHAKVLMKAAQTGGALHWHQDYGCVCMVRTEHMWQILVSCARALPTLCHRLHRTDTQRRGNRWPASDEGQS